MMHCTAHLATDKEHFDRPDTVLWLKRQIALKPRLIVGSIVQCLALRSGTGNGLTLLLCPFRHCTQYRADDFTGTLKVFFGHFD